MGYDRKASVWGTALASMLSGMTKGAVISKMTNEMKQSEMVEKQNLVMLTEIRAIVNNEFYLLLLTLSISSFIMVISEMSRIFGPESTNAFMQKS
ncbi:hypothetical protein QQS21_010862 [Conoideocrella luteorostrata]|uniref:Uncharacterized protein n=1 Tax=Conoideocrella luteorostrata TaxID=1105319 RepID=A0AAJ0CGI8_9HYPO|nr:hypothetical protein QQS21_010862 [Conoideocrella luteorostrata]